jgi:hypothetical protein
VTSVDINVIFCPFKGRGELVTENISVFVLAFLDIIPHERWR